MYSLQKSKEEVAFSGNVSGQPLKIQSLYCIGHGVFSFNTRPKRKLKKKSFSSDPLATSGKTNIRLLPLANGPGGNGNSIDPAGEVGQEGCKRDKGNLAGVLYANFDIEGRVSLYKFSNIHKLDPLIMKKVMCQENDKDTPVKSPVLQETTISVIGFDDNGIEEVSLLSRMPEVIGHFISAFESPCVWNGDQASMTVPIGFVLGNIEREMIVMDHVV